MITVTGIIDAEESFIEDDIWEHVFWDFSCINLPEDLSVMVGFSFTL